MKRITRKVARAVRYVYTVVIERRCCASTHYTAYHHEEGVKAERRGRCIFMTVRSCGYCKTHCRMFCRMHNKAAA